MQWELETVRLTRYAAGREPDRPELETGCLPGRLQAQPGGQGPKEPAPGAQDQAPKRKSGSGDGGPELMREMSGGLGTALAASPLAASPLARPGMIFPKRPNPRYGLAYMCRLLLSMRSRKGGESSAKGAVPERQALVECGKAAQPHADAGHHSVLCGATTCWRGD